MDKSEFEHLLDKCCEILTEEANISGFESSAQFENRVREVLDEIGSFEVDFKSKPQAFPDIALGEYGVEVKFTLNDTWRSVANSILENQRENGVKYIYIVFGKMGGKPGVRWRSWDDSVIHVRTSHVPRYEVEVYDDTDSPKQSLFQQIGISYDEFRVLPMHEKMKFVRAYAKKIHPNEHLWWIEDSNDEIHTTGQARLYTSLSPEDKLRYRAEAALLCPEIVKSGRTRNKYDRMVIFLLTYYGIICHQARDLFSAGSVGNPSKDSRIENYIENALLLLEPYMIRAANTLDDRLFVEYWGESCPPGERIQRWLQMADEMASDWVPSERLFKDITK